MRQLTACSPDKRKPRTDPGLATALKDVSIRTILAKSKKKVNQLSDRNLALPIMTDSNT